MTESAISSLVKPLYQALDNPDTRPRGVWSTTLSKILHRKRPHFLVLHDKWVRACYWGDGDDVPVPRDNRSSSEYMVAITQAIAADLLAAQHQLNQLVGEVPEAAALSPLRLLDILAWSSQGKNPAVQ